MSSCVAGSKVGNVLRIHLLPPPPTKIGLKGSLENRLECYNTMIQCAAQRIKHCVLVTPQSAAGSSMCYPPFSLLNCVVHFLALLTTGSMTNVFNTKQIRQLGSRRPTFVLPHHVHSFMKPAPLRGSTVLRSPTGKS